MQPTASAPPTVAAVYHEWWPSPAEGAIPVLAIHGFTVRGDMFNPIRAAVTTHHPVLVPDLRGGARSAHLPGPVTTSAHGEDLLALLDQYHIPQVHVLGYSMGGLVAQWLALKAPHRVRTLTLSNTWAHKQGTFSELAQAYTLPLTIQTLGRRRLARFLSRQVMRDYYGFYDEQVYRWFHEVFATYTDDVLQESVEDMFAFDSRRVLPQLRLPTLILGGTDDKVVPPYHSQELARLIRGAELHLLPKGGHAMIFTHPETINHRLLDFWGRHPQA